MVEIEGDLAPDVKLLADAGYTVKLEVRFGGAARRSSSLPGASPERRHRR